MPDRKYSRFCTRLSSLRPKLTNCFENVEVSLSIEMMSENKRFKNEKPVFGSLTVSTQNRGDCNKARAMQCLHNYQYPAGISRLCTLRSGEHSKGWTVLCIQDTLLCVLCKQEPLISSFQFWRFRLHESGLCLHYSQAGMDPI